MELQLQYIHFIPITITGSIIPYSNIHSWPTLINFQQHKFQLFLFSFFYIIYYRDAEDEIERVSHKNYDTKPNPISRKERKKEKQREREREYLKMGDVQRIVVVVEDKEAARTALQWALHNLLRQGDVIVLLHVFSPPPRKKKSTAARLLRRHGYHLALSFREICDAFFNVSGNESLSIFFAELLVFFVTYINLISLMRDRVNYRRIQR